MTQTSIPQVPIENWQQVRDEWVAELEKMAADVERWSTENDWDFKRENKEVVEAEIGTYEVPTLRVQTMQGRIYFEPTARFVGGASGRIDITAIPSFWQVVLGKVDGNWRFFTADELEDLNKTWSRGGFTEVVVDLLKKR